jgi:hypothetical protein
MDGVAVCGLRCRCRVVGCDAGEQGRAAALYWSVRAFMQGAARVRDLRMRVLASLQSQLPTNTAAMASQFRDVG